MESKQNSFMEDQKKIENIRNIVEMVTGERILSTTRYRGEVEARMILASILKDTGMHVESIALSMKKSRYAAEYYLKRFNDLVELDSKFRSLYLKCKEMVVMNKFKDEPVNSYNIVGRLVQENEALKQELRLLKERMRPIYNFITEKEWMEDSNKRGIEQQG
jgi:hypothetical protein